MSVSYLNIDFRMYLTKDKDIFHKKMLFTDQFNIDSFLKDKTSLLFKSQITKMNLWNKNKLIFYNFSLFFSLNLSELIELTNLLVDIYVLLLNEKMFIIKYVDR